MAGSREPGRTAGVDLGRPGWTMLASASVTGDAFELFEEVRTTQGGPPPHVHLERDEAFYVLEGRYTFIRGEDELILESGEFIFVPRGTRHHFRTLATPSRTLIFVAPAGLEAFFREMGAQLASGATPLAAMTTLSASYDSHPVD